MVARRRFQFHPGRHQLRRGHTRPQLKLRTDQLDREAVIEDVQGSDPAWNLDDYLVDFDDIVWPGGQLVDLPLEMKVRAVGEDVATVLKEAHSCLRIRAELAATVLSLAIGDYVASFYRGKETTGADYKAFLSAYFPPVYTECREGIYMQLRCGLMHNLVAINPWRGPRQSFKITSTGEEHLVEVDGALVFGVMCSLLMLTELG